MYVGFASRQVLRLPGIHRVHFETRLFENVARSSTRPSIASRWFESHIGVANRPSLSAPLWCTRSVVPVGYLDSVVQLRRGIRCRYQCPRHREYHLQAELLALDFPHHLPPLLAVHLLPTGLRRISPLSFCLGFMGWIGSTLLYRRDSHQASMRSNSRQSTSKSLRNIRSNILAQSETA